MTRASNAWSLVALVATSGLAHAQPLTPERALAEQLFREGRALMEEGRPAEACPKLAESQRLDPGGGTLMNLALCHSQEGKMASAWGEYSEARDQAIREGHAARVEEANARLLELEPLLSRLTVTLPPEVAALPGLSVARNGLVIAPTALDAMIVDPGIYWIEVRADGKVPYATEVAVGPNADAQTAVIPSLADVPPPPVPPPLRPVQPAPQPVERESGRSGQRVAGLVIGGVGLAGLAAGAIAGIVALTKQSAADDICPDIECTDADAVALNQEARGSALAANIALPVGGALTILGAVLFFTAPDSSADRAAPRVLLWASPARAGLVLMWPL